MVLKGGIALSWYIWLIIAGLFIIIETFTSGFLIFWFGIGALVSMIISIFIEDIFIQTIIFIISSVILIFATKPFVKKFTNSQTISTNINSLIGKTGIVVKEIDNLASVGQVKVNGELWSAKSIDNQIISENTKVEIIKIDGVKLIVKTI